MRARASDADFYTPDAALIEIGASYLRIVSLSYLFNGLAQCYFLVMKLEGKASKSVVISVAALIADMTLDFFLIYGKAGAPKLGADGSAYSTVTVGVYRFCLVRRGVVSER